MRCQAAWVDCNAGREMPHFSEREKVVCGGSAGVIEIGPDAGGRVFGVIELEGVVAAGEGVEALAEVAEEDGFGDAADAAVGVGDVDDGAVGLVEGVVRGDDVGEEGLVGCEVEEAEGAGRGGADEDGAAVPCDNGAAGVTGAGFKGGAGGGDNGGVEPPGVAGLGVVYVSDICLRGAVEDFAGGDDGADAVGVHGDESAEEDGAGIGVAFFPHVVVGLFVTVGVTDGDELGILFGVESEEGVDLAEVVAADGELGLFAGSAERGEEDGDEEGDDGDDDEEFDEGEGGAAFWEDWGHAELSGSGEVDTGCWLIWSMAEALKVHHRLFGGYLG